jgi:hypothetical protein
METAKAVLTLQHRSRVSRVDATRVRFSAHRCFARDDGDDDRRCIQLLANHLVSGLADKEGDPRLAVCADDAEFLRYVMRHTPGLRKHVRCVVRGNRLSADDVDGLPLVSAEGLPPEVETVFLCETRAFPLMQMRKRLSVSARVVAPDVLPEIAVAAMPARAWTPWSRDIIYPIDVPEIEFKSGLDLLLIDCPARNLGLMPNGLGYVHNALKQTSVNFQTRDLDIILYHRFHIRRLFDEGGVIRLPNGRALPTDPWQAEHYDLWSDPEVIAYFEPEIDEVVAGIVAARPKILGLSIQGCNEHFSTAVVKRVKAALPEIIVLVGGFSCYSPDIGLRGFPLADYMCIGEADLTVGALVERLAAGERPKNTPGVLSRFDDPAFPFIPAPMPHDLDLIEHPHYEWYDLNIYRNYNAYQLTPVIASRGCRWSRCTFCAERFYWRIRSPKAFVDELEWLVGQGCRLFMFNESDLNGKPEVVLAICDEIIRRNLRVKLTGQLRIHRKSDRAFFQKLHQAGFVALRFGVDAFSENTLRLQKKGYTTATVCQNLKDCWESGIYTEVNWVIGVPGESDQDIEEGIELIIKNKPYIGRLANINPLILVTGGVYWIEPEQHNIQFRGIKEELYRTHPRAIPAHKWYSTDPYIDEKVRKRRFERIVLALHEAKFDVGAWAARVIEDVQKNRDVNRAGLRDASTNTTEGEPGRARMSDGVGRMEKPAPPEGESKLEFNADARSSAYVFRAGSALPDDAVIQLKPQLYVVREQGELYSIAPEALEAGFGRQCFATPGSAGGTISLDGQVKVRFVTTPAARPELVQSISTFNIVAYDGLYYALPWALGPVQWGVEDVGRLSGVFVSKNQEEAFAWAQRPTTQIQPNLAFRVRRFAGRAWRRSRFLLGTFLARTRSRVRTVLSGKHPGPTEAVGKTAELSAPKCATTVAPAKTNADKPRWSVALPIVETTSPATGPSRSPPRLVGSLEGYNVVEFEGWFYGIPQALGPLDLTETDVIEMPGVIRDLSRDVVENEVREAVLAQPVK